jgi:hypothetical protein
MNEIKLEIDGKQLGFHEVWVHLQDVSHQKSVEYRISVAAASIRQVFDPYSTKGSDTSWANFVQETVAEFGTFIVEGFIDNITAIVGKREKVYVWVIATVDEVGETEEGIGLIGRAVPCVPSRF